MKIKIIVLSCLLMFSCTSYADEITVAVASNFKYTLQKLVAGFREKTSHDVTIISGSSGKLFAQLVHGAPYDVFLSADERYPDLLIKQKIAIAKSSYIYAQGKLVLLSNIGMMAECKDVLTSDHLKKLAIANPGIAPYGLAARQVLTKLGLWNQLQSRLVMGENIAQTFQFISTKNAGAGFVASAMFHLDKAVDSACVWHVPVEMHSAINQKLVVLKKAKDKTSVKAFMSYIRSPEVQKIIRAMGYDIPQQ